MDGTAARARPLPSVLLSLACASVVLAGCIRRPGAEPAWVAWAACTVGDPVASPINSPADLAGEYEITLYATSGPDVGETTTGWMTLSPQAEALLAVPDVDGTPLPGPSMPLYGSAEIDLGRVGATAAGELRSTDPEAPGVGFYAQTGQDTVPQRLTLRLGTEANRRGQVRFDGTYMSLMVRAYGETGLMGEWQSGGVEGEDASGRFCATRRAARRTGPDALALRP